METEVKPSFSLKYIILVLLTAAITGGITVIIQKYQEDEKKLAVTIRGGNNELKTKKNNDAIIVKYSLKNDTSEVRGYYRKTIILNNIGNVGLENIKCKISSKDTNIILLPNPKFESFPKEIGTIDFKINKIKSYKNDIHIPLLNKDEGISISYEAYSKEVVPYLDLDISIRQKNLKVEKIESLVVKDEDGIISTLIKFGKYIFGGLISILIVLSGNFYINWRSSTELRNRHNGNFWTYWWNGY